MVSQRLPTNRVHGVRCELKHAIKHKGATLEKHVTPVPAVILDDIVGFGLYPQVEPYQGYPSEPPVWERVSRWDYTATGSRYLATCIPNDRPSGTRKQANANMQYDRKSLGCTFCQHRGRRRRIHGDPLEQNDIHDLTKQEPGVVLQRQVLEFLRNGGSDRSGQTASRRRSSLRPSSRQAAS